MQNQLTYGIIGNGRVARHFQYYFDQLLIPYVQWDRQSSIEIEQALQECQVILVLIRDDAIEPFLQEHPELQQKICAHFSGALVTPLAIGVHPHCNFTQDLYAPDFYPRIPFVMEKCEHAFSDLFPKLPNPHYAIPAKKRAEYHALCVICGNFPTLLWQEATKTYQEMGLPADFFHIYIQNIVEQYKHNPTQALTGPFARKDLGTIEKNQQALQNPKLKAIYTAFKKNFL
ncbi:MAG: DUF2520 domain-containing protein [Bdellovibrionota bacterium]